MLSLQITWLLQLGIFCTATAVVGTIPPLACSLWEYVVALGMLSGSPLILKNWRPCAIQLLVCEALCCCDGLGFEGELHDTDDGQWLSAWRATLLLRDTRWWGVLHVSCVCVQILWHACIGFTSFSMLRYLYFCSVSALTHELSTQVLLKSAL